MTLFTIDNGGNIMGLRKHTLAIIVLSSVVLVGGGMIGYKFYQESKAEATAKDLKQAEEGLQKEIRKAETKVISAEMNPIQENIEAAEAEIQLLTESEGKQALLERLGAVKEKFNSEVKAKEEARLAELREEINQAKIELGIDGSPSEKKLLEILHKMTHQKVRAEKKWGFIQMTEVNLIAVKEVLEENPILNENINMLEMVTTWLSNEFSNIAADHNRLWGEKEGTIGKAYGRLSQAEEEALVKEQFGVQQ
jgi:hypothetical protein